MSGIITFDSSWDYTNSNQGWFPAGVSYSNLSSDQRFGFFNIYDDSSRAFRFFLTDHSGDEKNILSFGIDSNNNTFITGYNNKAIAMYDDVIPRSGGAVLSGSGLFRTVATNFLTFSGGTDWQSGGGIALYGPDYHFKPGRVQLVPATSESQYKAMTLETSGTWTWDGTACQLVSDQRLKQQIAEIDDKLLDAWEDVELSQFKYNDAVDQKGDTARLHTGYVVQQIDEACKSHNLDISKYGLYCHEEYPERTEEVTTENEDGTTSKETKVIEPAREHYSLRYTEVYAVECAYLRREVSRLKQQNEDLEQRLRMLEQSVK